MRVPSSVPASIVLLIPCAAPAAAQSPVTFEPNRGQAAEGVHYIARTAGGAALLSGSRTVLQAGGALQRMEFIGATEGVRSRPAGPLPGKSHYFRGSDPARWVIGVPQYDGVRFDELYPGIDLVWRSNAGRLEYDLELEPGAALGQVVFRFDTAVDVSLDERGNLRVASGGRETIHEKPVAWQGGRDGARREVECGYTLAQGSVGFEVGQRDMDLPLVIDPVLVFATHLGGTLTDGVGGVAIDSAGDVIITGATESIDFLASGAPAGSDDIYVCKLSADGSTLLWSTFLGGSASDYDGPHALVLDGAGRACIVGSSQSTDFPTTPGCFQPASGGTSDVVVAVLSADGSALEYSTYLGGPGFDVGEALALDAQGRLVAVGAARAGFPATLGSLSTTIAGDADMFVSVLAPAGGGSADLVYSTYLGGGLFDRADAVAVDLLGRIHLCGIVYTQRNFVRPPTTATGFKPTLSIANNDTSYKYAGYYAVVLPASVGLADLVYATFLHERQSAINGPRGLALDGLGRACIAGTAYGAVLTTTTNAYDASPNGAYDAYLMVVDPARSGSSSLSYGSYFGSSQSDYGEGVTVGSDGRIYVVGASGSTTPPPGTKKNVPFPTTADALSRISAGQLDCTLTVFDIARAPSQQILYSTLYGGTGTDRALQIVERPNGRFFIGGNTAPDGNGIPTTPGAFDPTYNGDWDGIFLRIDF